MRAQTRDASSFRPYAERAPPLGYRRRSRMKIIDVTLTTLPRTGFLPWYFPYIIRGSFTLG